MQIYINELSNSSDRSLIKQLEYHLDDEVLPMKSRLIELCVHLIDKYARVPVSILDNRLNKRNTQQRMVHFCHGIRERLSEYRVSQAKLDGHGSQLIKNKCSVNLVHDVGGSQYDRRA